MRAIRVTIPGLYYLGLMIIRKSLLFFLLPILALSLLYNFILLVKSNPMVVLLACSSIIIAIETGTTSSKPSSKDLELSFYPGPQDHLVPYQEEYTQYEDYGILALEVVSNDHSSKSYSEDDFDSIFMNHLLPLEHVEAEAYEGKRFREKYYEEDNTELEFCPRLVYVEYYKEKQVEIAASTDQSLAAPCALTTTSQMLSDEKLVNKDYHVDDHLDLSIGGFHGYGEDDDDIEEKRDLKRRIEEFIEKNNRKWKEDRLNEKLL